MPSLNRRKFLVSASATALGCAGMPATLAAAAPSPFLQSNNPNLLGPREGYTPHIGSVVSMLDWMRMVMLMSVKGMSQKELDFLLDKESNSIGAMLYHLAATDRWYYLNTFKGVKANDIARHRDFQEFNVAMDLGDAGRRELKGHDLDFYLEKLETTREATKKELSQHDDEWLLSADADFPWGPTNNYCKWFHVCEHESNHNGQIKLIRSRIS